jgi:hypothetical protein
VRHTGRNDDGRASSRRLIRGDAIVAVARNAEGSSEDDNGVPSDENIPVDGPGDDSVAPVDTDVSTDEQPGGSE